MGLKGRLVSNKAMKVASAAAPMTLRATHTSAVRPAPVLRVVFRRRAADVSTVKRLLDGLRESGMNLLAFPCMLCPVSGVMMNCEPPSYHYLTLLSLFDFSGTRARRLPLNVLTEDAFDQTSSICSRFGGYFKNATLNKIDISDRAGRGHGN